MLYKSNGHKGVFSPRYRHDAAAGRGKAELDSSKILRQLCRAATSFKKEARTLKRLLPTALLSWQLPGCLGEQYCGAIRPAFKKEARTLKRLLPTALPSCHLPCCLFRTFDCVKSKPTACRITSSDSMASSIAEIAPKGLSRLLGRAILRSNTTSRTA